MKACATEFLSSSTLGPSSLYPRSDPQTRLPRPVTVHHRLPSSPRAPLRSTLYQSRITRQLVLSLPVVRGYRQRPSCRSPSDHLTPSTFSHRLRPCCSSGRPLFHQLDLARVHPALKSPSISNLPTLTCNPHANHLSTAHHPSSTGISRAVSAVLVTLLGTTPAKSIAQLRQNSSMASGSNGRSMESRTGRAKQRKWEYPRGPLAC